MDAERFNAFFYGDYDNVINHFVDYVNYGGGGGSIGCVRE